MVAGCGERGGSARRAVVVGGSPFGMPRRSMPPRRTACTSVARPTRRRSWRSGRATGETWPLRCRPCPRPWPCPPARPWPCRVAWWRRPSCRRRRRGRRGGASGSRPDRTRRRRWMARRRPARGRAPRPRPCSCSLLCSSRPWCAEKERPRGWPAVALAEIGRRNRASALPTQPHSRQKVEILVALGYRNLRGRADGDTGTYGEA